MRQKKVGEFNVPLSSKWRQHCVHGVAWNDRFSFGQLGLFQNILLDLPLHSFSHGCGSVWFAYS